MVVPGANQLDFLSAAFKAGMFPDIEGTMAEFIGRRRERQRELRRSMEIRFSSGLWVQVNERPTHDHGFAAVYTDITERKHREAELARTHREATEARQQLSAAIEAIDEGFVLFDAEDRITLRNETYRNYFVDALGQEMAAFVEPGVTFETLITEAVMRGMFAQAQDDHERYIARRLADRQETSSASEIEFANGTLFPALKNMEVGPQVEGDDAEATAAQALRRRRILPEPLHDLTATRS